MNKKIKLLLLGLLIGAGVIVPKYCEEHNCFDECWIKEVHPKGTNSGKE